MTWEKIVEHIDHPVKTAGVDHVGLGSDFDGATMPLGMEDASKLPKITDALLKKGYSEADIEKILGGNILRVMTMSATGLKTLDTLGTTHDEQERAALRQEYESTNQGTIYPALVRLQQRDSITSHWGESDNKRRAKFYELTRVGRRHLAAEIEKWERVSWVVSRLLTEEA